MSVLNLIDEASKFHVAQVVYQDKVKTFNELGNCDADTYIEALEEWCRSVSYTHLTLPTTPYV